MNQNNVPQPEERLRAQQCLDLRIQGHTYQYIADRLGYADRSGARRAIERLLDRTEFETVDEYRALESDRLDALHRAHWPAAMLGDVEATKLVVKISERLSRRMLWRRAARNRGFADPPMNSRRRTHSPPVG